MPFNRGVTTNCLIALSCEEREVIMKKAFLWNLLIVLGIFVIQMLTGFVFGAVYGVSNADAVVNSTVTDIATSVELAMNDNAIVNAITTVSGIAMILSLIAMPITAIISVIGLIRNKIA